MRLRNNLRTYRRRWHLTQDELAFIFGYTDQSIIARLERQQRPITLAVAYACELLFGVTPAELFPAYFEGVEQAVIERMHQLRDRLLRSAQTQRTLAKLELLHEAIRRVTTVVDQEA